MKYNIPQLIGIGTTLFFLSIGGSITSTRIREGIYPAWAAMVFTFLQALVWIYQVKFTKMPLLFNSAFYDIVVCSTWLFMLAYMGDPLQLKQKIGFCLALAGILSMA